MADAGLIVLVCCISPFRAARRMAREPMEEGAFRRGFVDRRFGACAKRHPKAFYARPLKCRTRNLPCVDSRYEPPERADIHLQTVGRSPEEMVDYLEDWLREWGYC